jgi:hypothetical protein
MLRTKVSSRKGRSRNRAERRTVARVYRVIDATQGHGYLHQPPVLCEKVPEVPDDVRTDSPATRLVRILLLESGTGPGGRSISFGFCSSPDHSKAHVIAGLYFPIRARPLRISRSRFQVVFFQGTRPVARKPCRSCRTLRHPSEKPAQVENGYHHPLAAHSRPTAVDVEGVEIHQA